MDYIFISLNHNFVLLYNQNFSPEIPTNGQMIKPNFHVLLSSSRLMQILTSSEKVAEWEDYL